ncbi:ArsC/Spx/MgsR family protein [Lactococcus petauri]|uniref:ArsC/Spx/MgsR family protein n=1 Tax=Lactococcus petauri TaxID=1940789 RepID=UPI0032B42B2B
MTKDAVVYILSLTNNGFLDILKYTTRLSLKKLDQIKYIETSTFNTSVNYILENTNILRSPLIVDQNKLLIGYKAEDIRIFYLPNIERLKYPNPRSL